MLGGMIGPTREEVAVMAAAKALGANKAQVLHYSTSGETSGDYKRVVGYGAAAFLKT